MTELAQQQKVPKITDEQNIIKSDQGHAHFNKEGLLEIEEIYEEDVH